jgi:hypothetical protein
VIGRAAFPRVRPDPRAILVAIAGVLLAAGAVTAAAPPPQPAAAPSIAQRLGPHTYGLAIPVAWLTAPIPGLRDDDVIDLLATRPGERATASEVAGGLRVMAADDRNVVVELTADDAGAIAAARARGLVLIPILRSLR